MAHPQGIFPDSLAMGPDQPSKGEYQPGRDMLLAPMGLGNAIFVYHQPLGQALTREYSTSERFPHAHMPTW